MSTYSLNDFTSIPAGGEALPPEGSEYNRAIHLPGDTRDTPRPWALVRGEGPHAVVDWVDANYLLVSGFAPEDRLGMTFMGPRPETEGGEPITVRIAVNYPPDEGVSAWSVAREFPNLVGDADVLHRLVQLKDRSALALLSRLNLSGEEGK